MKGKIIFCFVFSEKMKRATSPQFKFKENFNKSNKIEMYIY